MNELLVALADVTFNAWGFRHENLQNAGDIVKKVSISFIDIVTVEREGKKPYKRLDFEINGMPSSCLPSDILNARTKKGKSTLLKDLQDHAKKNNISSDEEFIEFPANNFFNMTHKGLNDKGYAIIELELLGSYEDFLANH